MKYLIILLFTISTAYGICDIDTNENVNSCTVNDRLYSLIKDVRPTFRNVSYEYYFSSDPCVPQEEITCSYTCTGEGEDTVCTQDDPLCVAQELIVCPPWNPSLETYTFSPDPCTPSETVTCDPWLNTYEHLIIDPVLPLDSLKTALDTWKVQETTRIDYWERLDALEHLVKSITPCSAPHSSGALTIKYMKESLDETLLTCMESKQAEISASEQTQKDEAMKRKDARALLRNYDCSTETGLLKILCEAR